ncbi:MAG TPA: VWA domain-containing protein [Candidatus Baltobacteraceae bacterium]|jgi:Ca-activated chloride channel family protein|nr:VWA domain-containing protein [Candidatus Baltobacteraceae bacterium]
MRFAQPQVLWVLLAAVPALIGFLYWSWRAKQKMILQFVRPRLLSGLTVGVSPGRQKFRLGLLVVAVAGILLALARPQWGFAWEEARFQGLDIIVAIDTSRSMLAQDVAPNRLEKAKLAAIDLMRLAKTDRLGLVAFAGTAFLQAPLTVDEQAFEQAVDAVSVGIIPQGGTALSAAIRTAMGAFEKGNDNHKVLVLFTDGEDHDADTETLAAAKEAADAGLRIFTIGVGTPEGELLRVKDDQGNSSYIKDDDGNVVKSRLNQTLLEQIATDANGFYLPLQGANPMDTLYTRGLAPLPKSEESTRLTRVYQERYHWPLGFAIVCLVIEALLPESPRVRRPVALSAAPAVQQAVAIMALLLVALNALGSPSSAYRDYQSGDFKAALDEYSRLAGRKTNDYRLKFDAGSAAYRAKELEQARKQFNDALNSQSIVSDPKTQEHTYYDLGNTLYQMGEPLPEPDKKQELWQQAIENLGRAYRLDTNDIDARNNLAYVKQKLEELKKQQQQQQNQKQKDNKDQKDKKDQQDQKNQNQKDQKDQKDQKGDQQKSQQDDQQKKDEEKAKQEQAKKDAEKEKQQQQAQANSSDKRDKDAEKGEQTAMAEAKMSPEEARRLLDSQQDNEKVLIFAPENKPVDNPSVKIKDW